MPPKRKSISNPVVRLRAKRAKYTATSKATKESTPPSPTPPTADSYSESESESEDSEQEWESVLISPPLPFTAKPSPSGSLELTLNPSSETPTNKKGTSTAQQRRVRTLTHCIHVQFLLFHGAIRNRWLNDPEVQAGVLSLVPARIMRDLDGEEDQKGGSPRAARTLLHWWAQRFTVTAPGLRKRGYGCPGEGGEVVAGVEELRVLARDARGSRDIGALLFTALCRALGWETRSVFSLQPLGFGAGGVERARQDEDDHDDNGDDVEGGEKKVNGKGKGKGKEKGKHKGKQKQVDGDSEVSVDLSSMDDSDSGDFIKPKSRKPAIKKQSIFDKDLLYPVFWTELLCYDNTYLSLSAFPTPLIGNTPDITAKFEPRGKKAMDARQVICYVIAYSNDTTARDVTARYLRNRTFPGKTKGFRIPVSQVPLYATDGSVVTTYTLDWFQRILRPYQRKPYSSWAAADQADDAALSKPTPIHEPKQTSVNPTSISGYKAHPTLILSRHLKRDEALSPGTRPISHFTPIKGGPTEEVYLRSAIVTVKSAESWYREGRTLLPAAQPLKSVPRRAVTLARKRQLQQGEATTQGLYSFAQTQLYTPPPLAADGVIPTNDFGNIDVYVPSMVPAGCVHLAGLKGVGRIAKQLGVHYADAVTGFEFRQQRAMPVLDGVVVARESEDVVRDAYREAEAERRKKEEGKKEERALERWRRFLLRARVLRSLRERHREGGEEEGNPFERRDLNWKAGSGEESVVEDTVDEEEGGFKDDGDGEKEVAAEAGGFLLDDDDDKDERQPTGGGFILDPETEPQLPIQPEAKRDNEVRSEYFPKSAHRTTR